MQAMKTPKIQWLDYLNDPDLERCAQSLEGRFYIHGFKDLGYTLEIREIRYGLKDQPNTVRIIKLSFTSLSKAKRFAQRRIGYFYKGQFDRADLEVADLEGTYAVPQHQQCKLEEM